MTKIISFSSNSVAQTVIQEGGGGDLHEKKRISCKIKQNTYLSIILSYCGQVKRERKILQKETLKN